MPSPSRPDDDPRPAPPERPSNDDCCQCGCNPCIFDLYDEAMERWRAELAAWEVRHAKRDEPREPQRRQPRQPGARTEPALRRQQAKSPAKKRSA